MKSIAIFLLFVGTVLIIQGYYSNKSACPTSKPKIKYIPRSTYEEQLSDIPQDLPVFYKDMFATSKNYVQVI